MWDRQCMAFGQQSGPPATGKQIRDLLDLLVAAGHDDFRDARGPMGFTQRQAGGKFTRDEAQAFIDQLEAEAEAGPQPPAATPAPTPRARAAPRPKASQAERQSPVERALSGMSDQDLAAELQRRGWIVVEP